MFITLCRVFFPVSSGAEIVTSSSTMAESPRELDQRFQGGQFEAKLLIGYFSCHCDMTQFTLTHHMVIKHFFLLGLAAEYRSRWWM